MLKLSPSVTVTGWGVHLSNSIKKEMGCKAEGTLDWSNVGQSLLSPSFKGINIRIPMVIPFQGRGFKHHGSTLGLRA